MSNAEASIVENNNTRKVSFAVQRFKEAEQRNKALAAPVLDDVLALVPSDDQMAKITKVFAIEAGDVDELTGAGSNLVRDQYTLFAPILVSIIRGEENYQGLKLHLDRIVDSLVRSAYGAANFYENRRMIAKDASNIFSNESRVVMLRQKMAQKLTLWPVSPLEPVQLIKS